jgi:hypothetical protein
MSKYHANNVVGSIGNNSTTYFNTANKDESKHFGVLGKNSKIVYSTKNNTVVTLKNYTSEDGKYHCDNFVGSIGDNATTFVNYK